MVLDVFLNQKWKGRDGRGHRIGNVKIGTKEGSCFFYTGKAEDFRKGKKKAEAETNEIVKSLQKMKYDRMRADERIEAMEKKLSKAMQREAAWDEYLNREVVEAYDSVSEENVLVCIIEGNEKGNKWLVEE